MNSVGVLTSHVEPDDLDLYSKAEESVGKVHLLSARSTFTDLSHICYQLVNRTVVI